MDPTVIAAAIGVGGTVIVGVAGFWSTKTASDKAAKVATANTVSALDAARDERIWDRRARAYEQAVAALLYRRQQRQHLDELHGQPLLSAAQWRPSDLALMFRQNVRLPDQPFFDHYAPRGWVEVEGTLLAYATEAVIAALEAARQADETARIALDRCWELQSPEDTRASSYSEEPAADLLGASKPDPDAQAKLSAAQNDLKCALEEAECKDNDLINAIRNDLNAKPSKVRPQAKSS